MKYFAGKFKCDKKHAEISSSINAIVYEPSNDIFIFPFCLFNKQFYSRLIGYKNRIFTGEVKGRSFNLFKHIRYGSASTTREINIKGKIEDEDCKSIIHYEFHTPTYEIVIEVVFTIAIVIGYFYKLQSFFLIIPFCLFISRAYLTAKYLLILKLRINKAK
jgi:hypothetical protein